MTEQSIAKNTVFLYIRMIIIMIISLYTSRVILQTLGVTDFGIYNVIAGIVVLLAFFQTAITNASQRFISYELGCGSDESVNRIFCVNITVLLLIACIIFVLLETVGLWIVNSFLNLPSDRLNAANWVYQFSILTFVINIIRVPYNATIIANERMKFYAYISILEALLKLVVVYALILVRIDKLILYAFLLLSVSILFFVIYRYYCLKTFNTCKFHIIYDKQQIKQILSFSGWSMLGAVSNVTAQQGGNIILNIFNGVVSNAAFGIANQVSHAVYSFSSNLQTAFNPRITKLYAIRDYNHLIILINRASFFSYYLMLILAVPIMINMPFVLTLWLKEVPEYAVGFCQLMLIYQLIDAFQAPLGTFIYATGSIKNYNIWLSALIFLNLPLSIMFLSLGFSIYSVLIIRCVINIITAIIRMIYVKRAFDYPSAQYVKEVVTRVVIATTVVFCFPLLIKSCFQDNFYGFILSSFIYFVITLFIIYFIGVRKDERIYLKNLCVTFMKRYARIKQ